jgi:hypothetical protein
MNHKTLNEHLIGPGPKRILALDGGGIRGALTLGYLERLENILRERAGGDPEFRLCDYFDLIGGTSTGSIIATGLAMGFTIKKLQEIYRSLSNDVFKTSFFKFGVVSAKFQSAPLIKALTQYFGDATLGSDQVKTGLLIMTKRLDTGSPWAVHNNPTGRYFHPREGTTRLGNKDYLLRDVVRASTAAPHYFEPEKLQIAHELFGAFVDGGVSPFNNPALQTFMLATMEGYGFNWPFGENNLLLVSVGTGGKELRLDPAEVLGMSAINLAAQSILSIMSDADWLGQTMLQWMSRSPTAWVIDREVGNLKSDVLGDGEPLLSYLRYNVPFNAEWLKENLYLNFSEEDLKSLFAMDQPKNVQQLADLGTAAAAFQIKEEHFPAVFDIE